VCNCFCLYNVYCTCSVCMLVCVCVFVCVLVCVCVCTLVCVCVHVCVYVCACVCRCVCAHVNEGVCPAAPQTMRWCARRCAGAGFAKQACECDEFAWTTPNTPKPRHSKCSWEYADGNCTSRDWPRGLAEKTMDLELPNMKCRSKTLHTTPQGPKTSLP